MTSRLFVSSRVSIDSAGESVSSFEVNLPETINRVADLELMNCSITFTPKYPSIPLYENTFSAKINGTQYTASINSSYVYNSPTDLINALNVAWAAAGGTGTFSYNGVTTQPFYHIVFTCANPADTVQIMADSVSTLNKRLGVSSNDYNFTGSATFSSPPSILRTQVIYVCSSLVNDSLTPVGGVGEQIITPVFVSSSSYGDVIFFELSNSFARVLALNDTFSSFSIYLLDDNYKPLEMCENALFTCEVQLNYSNREENLKAPLVLSPFQSNIRYSMAKNRF